MAAKSFQITLTAAAKRLSDVYLGQTAGGPGGPAENIGGGVSTPDARSDIAYRQILFTTEADAFLGAASTVTSTTYGIKIATAATVAVGIGPYETGPVKLSDLWAAGSGVLHILAIPF